MPYTTFVRLCLQFQLNNHEKYLASFRASFLYHDGDNDGILDTEEFRYVAPIRGRSPFNTSFPPQIKNTMSCPLLCCLACCLVCVQKLLHGSPQRTGAAGARGNGRPQQRGE